MAISGFRAVFADVEDPRGPVEHSRFTRHLVHQCGGDASYDDGGSSPLETVSRHTTRLAACCR